MQQVKGLIKSKKLGEPFSTAEFLNCGGRAAVDKALSRLVKEGEIKRLSRGVFVRPKISQYVGEVSPPVEKVVEIKAKESGSKVGIQGAEAVRRFGFSTQMPVRSVYYTNGPSRKFKVGNQVVQLKRVNPRKLVLAGRPAGEALSALWYLGKYQVNLATFKKVWEQLPAEEYEALTEDVGCKDIFSKTVG